MNNSDFTWLHLSDFHVGKDSHGQRKVFKRILSEVSEQKKIGNKPDFVFITGDIANKGLAKEYVEFDEGFLIPLINLLGEEYSDRIFLIPGNHDVTRSEAKGAIKHGILESVTNFLDPTEDGLKEREYLLNRFQQFEEHDWFLDADPWLSSEAGYTTKKLKLSDNMIGVLSLNTSWLCDDKHDYKKITPGVEIVEEGLDELSSCDKIIVLGHHPLDWMIPSDAQKIENAFARNNVIYLHGHMHKSSNAISQLGYSKFISIQSGCVFDTRDDDEWLTRIIWAGYDLSAKELFLLPKKWKNHYSEWGIDSDAFPEDFRVQGNDLWCIPAASEPKGIVEVKKQDERKDGVIIPMGWRLLDAQFLKERNKVKSDEVTLQYFEGRGPTWADILNESIPEREIVDEIVEILSAGVEQNQKQFVLLLGAGGEGKSTVFYQVLKHMVNNQKLNVLWRHDSTQPLPIEFIKQIRYSKETWLVASDEGDSIAKDTQNALQYLSENGNLQMFLTCRDTDWIEKRGHDAPWPQIAGFYERKMKGLSFSDAKAIVRAWSQFGERGLGKLAEVDEDDAVKLLLSAAQDEASSDHGAFLGAMLRVRIGDALRDHVAELMGKLNDCKIKKSKGGKTLLDAFMLIAVPHSFNILFLSKSVLARALDIESSQIRRLVLKPLGEEAAAEAAGEYILTRHRAIAEAAMDIGEDRFDFDAEDLMCELAAAAIEANANGEIVPYLRDWRYLSDRFFKDGHKSFGVRLAKTVLCGDPFNSFLIVKLAQLYREAGQPEQAVKVFRSAKLELISNRAFFTEWSSSEGVMRHTALSMCITAASLADSSSMGFPKMKDMGFGLSGACLGFLTLYDLYHNPVFSCAALAADIIGRRIKLDFASFEAIDSKKEVLEELSQVFTITNQGAISALIRGFEVAYDYKEIEEDFPFIIPTALEFKALKAVASQY